MPILGAHVDSSGGLHLAYERARAMGADAIQVHPTPPGFWGSPKLDDNRIAAFKEAKAKHARLLIENNAGLGGCVGARFEEIRQMLDALDNDKRVAVCFDTCHAFASGYDERNAAEVKKTVDELDRVVGMSRVQVVHCNDSVTGLASNRDRHANIGDGQIGEEGFRALLHEPRLAKLPFILEVPGAGGGPDAEQVAILKRLAA